MAEIFGIWVLLPNPRKKIFESGQPYVRSRECAVTSECMNERVVERVDVEEEEEAEEREA